jgi:hypothetical protein
MSAETDHTGHALAAVPQSSPLWLELARVVAETERRLDGETTQPTFAGDADEEVG